MYSYTEQQIRVMGITQVIVILKTSASASAGSGSIAHGATELKQIARHFVRSARSQTQALLSASPAGMLRRSAVKSSRSRPDGRLAVKAPPRGRFYPNLGVLLGFVDRRGLAELRAHRQVEAVMGIPQISLIRPQRVAAAKLTRTVTWGIQALRIPPLWKQGLSGNGILIGHLDTGLDGTHPALRGAIAAFAQFDDVGREKGPAPEPFDSDQHGTHTAATIAGRPVHDKHVGVAPGAQLASAVVIEGGDAVARVLGGMDWAVGNQVRILSMSLGLQGYTEAFLTLTQILRARNILPIFAVGNEGPGTSRSPGNYAEAMSVGAFDESGAVAGFSSSQHFQRKNDSLVPDLVAPGVEIISAKPGGGYQAMDGTSMAAPHIAGLAALLMEARPEKTADEVEAAIFRSCELRPGMSPDRANRGVPDAVRALETL